MASKPDTSRNRARAATKRGATPAAPSSGGAPRESTARERAVRVVRRRFLAGAKLDMRALAHELGVSRATLYRRTGSREELLGEVIGTLAAETFEACKRTARGRGAVRIIDVFDRHFRMIAEAPALRAFLETDAETALRVLTMRDGSVQGRIVRAHTELIREEIDRGAYVAPVDPAVLAYAMVRLGEAFLYNDAIIALTPNAEQARAIVRLLLAAPARTAAPTRRARRRR